MTIQNGGTMSKDKMELEKAKKRLEMLLKDSCSCIECMKNKEAYKTILQALKDKDREIKRLYIIRNELDYGYENTHIITKNRIATIEKNKYLIEIEDGKFIDVKELYNNSISKN